MKILIAVLVFASAAFADDAPLATPKATPPAKMTEAQSKDIIILQGARQVTALMKENADLRKQIADLRDQIESMQQDALVKGICESVKIPAAECGSANPQTKEINRTAPLEH